MFIGGLYAVTYESFQGYFDILLCFVKPFWLKFDQMHGQDYTCLFIYSKS